MITEERAFVEARGRMVEEQIRRRGVADARVLAAVVKVPRHLFVEAPYLGEAYQDHPLPIGAGQTISQPYIVALMSELLHLTGTERVLEVGTGSGYQAAVLAELCREVVSVERFPELAERARVLLAARGYSNVTVVEGDGSLGYAVGAPYDAIMVTAAAPRLARPWVEQLIDGGRLVLPLGGRFGQMLMRLTKLDGHVQEERFGAVAFVPLVGEHGWGEG